MLAKVSSALGPKLTALVIQATFATGIFATWRNSAGRLAEADVEAKKKKAGLVASK